MTLAVGLVGTGRWATLVHAPSLAANEDVEFVGVWGRNGVDRARIATQYGVHSFGSFDDVLAASEAVAFAVPPAVQSTLATAAARAGKHLLLEKPIALAVDDATVIVHAAQGAGVSCVVFVTRLFDEARVSWLESVIGRPWSGAHVEWLSGALAAGGPYDQFSWRHQAGVLWDLGPHVLSQLVPVLGPVTHVAIDAWAGHGEIRLRFRHAHGAESSAKLTLHGDPHGYVEWLTFADSGSSSRSPDAPLDYVRSHRRALGALSDLANGGGSPGGTLAELGYSVTAGLEAVRVLDAVERLAARGEETGKFVSVRGGT